MPRSSAFATPPSVPVPPVPQTPPVHCTETHWVARSHADPSASRGTHAPALHHVSALQSESLVHFAPMQVFVVTSQTEVAPVQASPFVAVQVTHWFVAELQAGVAPEHFASVAHGSHFPLFVPLVMQSPERHSAVCVQVPSPVAKPHLLSAMSQTPLAQTTVATAGEQLPVSAGVWFATVGIGVPFESFGVHVPALHQFPPEQSASTVQPPAAWQTPIELHDPERHTAVASTSVQGPSPSL